MPDTCGAGRWRGGVGLRRSYRILAREALLQLRHGPRDLPTLRPGGRGPGGRSQNFIEIGNRREPLPSKVTMTVPHAALIVHEQAGGGGFGTPLRAIPRGSRRISRTARSALILPGGTIAWCSTTTEKSMPRPRRGCAGNRAPSRTLASSDRPGAPRPATRPENRATAEGCGRRRRNRQPRPRHIHCRAAGRRH